MEQRRGSIPRCGSITNLKIITMCSTESFYTGLQVQTREINLDWRIKVSGVDLTTGAKVHKLVGVSGLIDLVGLDLTNKFLDRAYRGGSHIVECKLRRGLKVVFYQK